MKRLLITAVMISVVVLTGSAQVFIGGSLGVNFEGGKTKAGSSSTDAPSRFAFEISPRAGYYLSDRMAIGLELGILRSVRNDRAATETKDFVTAFGVSAFGRYHLVEVDRFALILEASLGFQTAKAKTTTGSNSVEGDPMKGVGLFVLPVLSYSLSDRLSLEANCDFLRFGFIRASTKNDATDVKASQNYFGLGVNPSSLATAMSTDYREFMDTPFSVGLVWKF